MVGVDEVGRGAWAGPLLVVAARANGGLPAGLTDSKLMSKVQREKMLDLLSIAYNFGEGWVSAVEIDRHGLAKALQLGIKRALDAIDARIDEEIILDGKINYLPKKFKNARPLVKADNLIPIVSAASVHAKVVRDRYMSELAKRYPNFGFESHVGYGTSTHKKALQTIGALKEVHRFSYKPVAEFAR